MSEARSSQSVEYDQNLFFGVVALQIGLIDVSEFAEGCSAWATQAEGTLAQFLVRRGWLTAEENTEVERAVARKLQQRAAAETAKSMPLASPTGTYIQLSDEPLAEPENAVHVPAVRVRQPNSRFMDRGELHATGGMGQIWRVYDPRLGRDLAVKTLRPEIANDSQVRERFLLEARVMAQLAHPGLPPIHFLDQDERDRPVYAMQFLRGQTLDSMIDAYHRQPNPLALRDLLGHFNSICQTIAFAHSRHVIHRDLKPKNVLIGEFGETYVLDWGLAKQIAPSDATLPIVGDSAPTLTQAGQILGTPTYIPPEQLAGSPPDPSTDIYALGVILYEILTGRPPYRGTTVFEVLKQVTRGVFPLPSELNSGISAGLEEICLKAMSTDVADRYQSALALTRAMKDWLAEELLRSEAALRESESKLRLLLESTAEAIYEADLNGNCTFCNPACARLLGFQDPAELVGRHMHTLMHHHRADGTDYPLEECRIYQAFRDGRGVHVTDEVYWRADNTSFPVEYWSYPVRRDGQLVGCAVSFLDITDRVRRENELQTAKRKAEEALALAISELEELKRRLGE